MPTECSPDLFGFERVEGRDVVAAFAVLVMRDLGFEPSTRLEQGIPEFVRWFKAFRQS